MIKNIVTFLFVCVVGAVLFSGPANAVNCANPVGEEGDIIFNTAYNVPQYCNGTGWIAFSATNIPGGGAGCASPVGTRGDILFNSAQSVVQYCNGTSWVATQGSVSGSLAGPTGCATIGAQCADGTIFAGYHPVLHSHLFIPPTNQGSVRWRASGTANDIATDSWGDGQSNSLQVTSSAAYIASSTTFPANKLCKDLAFGGYTDWYLPSIGELQYLYMILPSLATGPYTPMSSGYYWSSSEEDDTYAWNLVFTSDGVVNSSGKSSATYNVRCMRR